jgi:protein-S-isoprenylcysteine O-methyltransferase Ste14
VILWAAGLFRKRGTTIIPFQVSSELVQEGPYRWTRNPMYLGMLGILSGTAWMLGSATPWLLVFTFLWWISTRFIAIEERMLGARFGESYRDYQKRVRRWL